VPAQRPTREALIALAKSDPEAIADLVLQLWDRVDALEARVRDLARNTTRLPIATAAGRPPPTGAASIRRPSRRACGRSPDASPAGRTVMPARPCSNPIAPIVSSSIVSGPTPAAPSAGRFWGRAPANSMRSAASGARSSSFPPYASRSSSTARSAASAPPALRRQPPPSPRA